MNELLSLNEVDSGQGFIVSSISSIELDLIRELILEQYLSRLAAQAPKQVCCFSAEPITQYHQHAQLIEHRKMWPKGARILGPKALASIKESDFFRQLSHQLNITGISTEEKCGWEEMYWRIVRPGHSDIGDLHADRWFWDLGHGEIPKGMRRVKIWMAINTVEGESGLRVIPYSHQRHDWKYHGEVDHTGIAKPKFDEDISNLNIYNVPTKSGDFIIFHDDLIHGGMPNYSNQTRISLEATLLIPLNN